MYTRPGPSNMTIGMWATKYVKDELKPQRKRIKRLMPCLHQHFEDAIETLCPFSIEMGPQGLRTTYGPLGLNEGMTILFANDQCATVLKFPEWPEAILDPPPELKDSFWIYINDAIEVPDERALAAGFLGRVGADLDAMKQRVIEFRLTGATPIIVCLVYSKVEGNDTGPTSQGVVFVLPLPVSIEALTADDSDAIKH
jgi:hypothetical protein